MLSRVKARIDGAGGEVSGHGHRGHDHGAGGHGHTHGVVDATLASTERGIWAIKWSFVILAITAALQLVVVYLSGSVALLADTIHNVGDAATAIPLWVAFVLVRRPPSARFNYGLGRVEDLAGMLIVAIILFSAVFAGYEAIDRLLNPQPIKAIGWVALAGVVGFLGNEAVAVFRIRVGRQMNSAALVADGYHARTDGLTSLAVVLGALGVWFGFPLADPLVGLAITVAILGIVWQSAKAVITRSLDGVEPGVADEVRHAAEHVEGIAGVTDVKARWIGHKLHTDVTIVVDPELSVAQASTVVARLKEEVFGHLPPLGSATVQFQASDAAAMPTAGPNHHHAPEPFEVRSDLAVGRLEIVATPKGERMRLTISRHAEELEATVEIVRPNGVIERLSLEPTTDHHVLQSAGAPAEPHQFDAVLLLTAAAKREALSFRMIEPVAHHH